MLMKILIIRNYPNYMDIKYNTYNIQEIGLAKALVKQGNVCDIVFWTADKETKVKYEVEENKSITIYYLNGINILKNAIYKKLDSIVANYDVIQPSEYNQIQSWLLAKKHPEKTIIYHGPYYSSFNKNYNALCKITDAFMLKAYIKNKTPFLVKSKLAKEFLVSKGISENQITVSGVGIDLDAFKIPCENNLPDEILKIKTFENKLKLLYIGKLEPRRSTDFLFSVLKKVRDCGIDAVLIIVGNGEPEYTKNAFEYAENLGVKEFIYHISVAEQKNISFVYENTDIFLLPTRYEIFGMVLLESMYFGKTVITTQNGGSDMLINSGENGIVIDSFDDLEWATAISKFKDSTNIGINAKKKAEKEYTWDSLSEIFISAYKKMLK